MAGSDDLLGKILLHGPSQGTLFLVLSRMKEEARVKEVIQGCIKALEAFPDDIRIRKLLAESYLEVGFVSRAESEMERVTAHLRDLAGIYKRKADLALKQGRRREALEALSIYIVFYPEDPEAQHLLEGLKPRVAPSIAPTKTEDTEPPVYSPEMATPTFAEICFAQGHVHEAVRVYEEYILKNPEDEDASRRLSVIRAQAQLPVEEPPRTPADQVGRARTERMIAILENWLAGIREWNRAH